MFKFEEAPKLIEGFTDSDWAGDVKDRKSTSGGIIMWGSHLIKGWSSAQNVIALSGGEAELYAMLKAATQAKGIVQLLADWNVQVEALIRSDASAALGIAHRSGLGKPDT